MSSRETATRACIGDRSAFPRLAAKAYLNHAAISPMCRPAEEALKRAIDDYSTQGMGAFPRWEAARARLRKDLAKLIGAEPGEVALGFNTSRGVGDVALSLPYEKGDRVILFEGEFPANITPWQRAAELFELSLCMLNADAFGTERGVAMLRAELARGARVVAVSFVQFQTGLRMPLLAIGSLCAEFGAELFVDAIQGLGAVPLDVRAAGIHYLASGGHKWLLGSEGGGMLYVRQDCAEKLRPYTAGWLSHEDPVSFLAAGAGHMDYGKRLRQRADVFETGTGSLLSLATLGATVPMLQALGVANVFSHLQTYHDALEPALVERGFESLRAPDPARRSGILSFRTPPSVDVIQLSAALRARGVMPGTPDGLLRFAPHFANPLAEVPEVLQALDAALKEVSRGRR